MNLAPPNPSFIQARDAILQADQVANQGANQTNLWAAFAKRGLGYSAAAPGSETTIGVVEAFDVPPPSSELWTYQAGHGIRSSPALGPDRTIYFGGWDGKLYALNPDGTEKWVFDPGSGPYALFDASPAVDPDGCVYIPRFDNKLFAVHPDGTLKWMFAAGGSIFSSPAIAADGTVYFGAFDHKVYAVNPDGTLKWAYLTGDIVYSSPALDRDGVVYVGSFDGRVYALNPDGTLRWASSPAVGPIYSSPAIGPKQNAVYVGSYDGRVYQVNHSDGYVTWAYTTGGPILSSPALDIDGNLYVGSGDSNLYSLAHNGTLRWTLPTGGWVWSSPAIGWDGRVFFASYDRKLYVAGTNGTPLASFLTGGELFSSPVVGADGRVYIGSFDSKLYAFPGQTLLAPSAWPMFRNDPRHLANHALIRLEDGAFGPIGEFRFSMYSSGFPFPGNQEWCLVEWSEDLESWDPLDYVRFVDTAYLPFANYAAIGSSVSFNRIKANASDFPRSRNPCGFITITLPPGDSMLSNPLNTDRNTLNGLMPNVPDGTTFHKWNPATQTFDVSVFVEAYGWFPDASLLPGEAGTIQNLTEQPFTITFIGEVLQGHLVKPLTEGLSLVGSLVPQAGGITSALGFGPEDGLASGDTLYRWDNGSVSFEMYTYETGVGWFRTSPAPTVQMEPELAIGEAFWVSTGGARNWTRSYSVWP